MKTEISQATTVEFSQQTHVVKGIKVRFQIMIVQLVVNVSIKSRLAVSVLSTMVHIELNVLLFLRGQIDFLKKL